MFECSRFSLSDDYSWDSLLEGSVTATFFQTKSWIALWQKHFQSEAILLKILKDDEVIGVVALEINNNTIGFLGTSKVLGGEMVTDFGDIVALKGQEETVWNTLLIFLKKNYPDFRMEFNLIREESPSVNVLRSLNCKLEETEVAPIIDLPNSWEEYLLSLDRHERHEVRRKIRRLESNKAMLVHSEGNLQDLKEFFKLMKLSAAKKDKFLTNKMKKFFSDFFSDLYGHEKPSLSFIKLNGNNIASAIYFVYKNEVLLYNSGFNPMFNNLSSGIVLILFLIKKAIEDGKREFEFLRGGEKYKFNLGGKSRKLYKASWLNKIKST